MKIENIKAKIQNRIPGPTRIQHYFSVLIPLVEIDGEIHLIYELRSKNLNTQPGEVSFPGGRIERGEEFSQAAVRECSEELLIPETKIELLGETDYLITPFNFIIYAFVGKINVNSIEEIGVNNYEVEEIFTVPLKFFLNHQVEKYAAVLKSEFDQDFPYHLLPQGEKYNPRQGDYQIYFYRYQGRVIWGITAEITKSFIDILKH
ncbi:ADP-ribose pyrophosphatase YjhB, NUDIX family [Halanaerobium kushneri]|uniref:ADP-ribose pyrophosphatase YjhB, NUDIX family n=1 Tax=Halanaerobium kushneri TaxID=56779 RepID=A0A1N6WC42_9FIRM|nr:ADP-ribose pyrophosphatase YjhB, NUDIX family [Halanaerobium kushneri]